VVTALRLSEVADASLPEFDFRNKLWVIPAERMKGKNAPMLILPAIDDTDPIR
jgi:hypothetical protein